MSLDQILLLPPGYGFDSSNASPTITVPVAQSAVSNVAKAITGTSLSDSDGNSQTVTLTVSHGTMTLAGTTGLTFSVGDGTSDATMTFSGSVANINTAIATITYTSALDYEGADSLAISTNDGAGGTDSDSIAITVAFTPASVSPALWAEIDAGVYSDAGTTAAVLDTDTVQQWNDQSGNARHITQATSGNRPAYATDSSNPAIVVAAGKRLLIPSATYKTWFIVARWDSISSGFRPLVSSPTDNMLIRNEVDNGIFTGASSYVGNGGTIRVDGASYTSGVVSNGYHLFTLEGYAQTSAFNLFWWQAGDGSGYDYNGSGAIKACVIFSGDLNSGHRGSMEAYLAARYGITL